MKRIEEYNYNLVKKDIENMYMIFKDLQNEEAFPILIMGWFQYFILICVEVLNYTKINKNLKYKKIIENCRARIKPLQIEYSKIYQKMEQLNLNKMNEYKGYVKNDFGVVPEEFINNYGLFKINNKIIGNTFLYESLYKKIIYENSEVSANKIISVSREVGEIICDLMNFLKLEQTYKGKTINIHVENEDYNVFKNNNELLNENIDTNDGLILLNSISIINFYKYIICKMNVRKELKYRLGYIVYDSTYQNIMKVIEKDKIKKINGEFRKYECLNNREFRNCMFHYNLTQNLKEEEIRNEMYMGIIYKCFGFSEDDYIKLIDEYMNEISSILEKQLLK